jgi:MT0933-like antitoxin protein
MGLLDKLKGLMKGRKNQIKQGIDKVADVVEKKAPDKHADKVESAAEKAKEIVDKLPD